MPTYTVDLNFSPQEFQQYYRKPGVMVWAKSLEGPSVQFPAACLQAYVTRDGLQGRFQLEIDGDKQLQGIRRI